MYQLRIDIREKCPRHPRYDPRQGQGAIRGACILCSGLWRLHLAADEAHRRLEVPIRDFEQLVNQYLNRRTRPKTARRAAQIAA